MAYDLFPEVEREAMARASGSMGVGEPGDFTGFGYGAGMYTMRGFADAARRIDLTGALGPIALDKLTGGTARQDEYFQQHDETFNRAVDYWTPQPGEVGAAGQIVGPLAGALPLLIASPTLDVASTLLSIGEDLVRQGVNAGPAIAVGAIQSMSLAAGLRLPFLGKTLASRVGSGAAGMVTLGATAAATSKLVLNLTGNAKEAEQFNPFDPTQRALDLLMGAAFGGLAHLDAKAKKWRQWRRDLIQPQVEDAILTLNQAKHLEDVALPGKAETPFELNQGVKAVQTAMDQMLRGEPVNVEQITQGMKVTADPVRTDWNIQASGVMSTEVKRVVNESILQDEVLRTGQPEAMGTPEVQHAVEIANKPGFQRTAEGNIYLDNVLVGKSLDVMLTPIERSQMVDMQAQARLTAALDAQISDLTNNRAATISDTAKDLQARLGLKAREAKTQAAAIYEVKLTELNGKRQPNAQETVKAPLPEAGTQAPGEAGSPAGGPKAQAGDAKTVDPVVDTANRIATERPDMMVPTGELDGAGNAVTMSAADYMAQASATAKLAHADAGIFKTAITCLLGVL